MSTLGERLDNRLADGLVALGVGLRRAWILGGTVADRVLGLIPASDAGLRRFQDGADALNAAESQVDSLDPWHSDGGPSEWRKHLEPLPIAGLFPSGQPVDLLDEPEPGVAQHDVYREIQEQLGVINPEPMCPTRLDCSWGGCDGTCRALQLQAQHSPSRLLTETPAYRRHRNNREFNTMPNWSSRTPQSSAPGHRSEAPVEVGSPDVASTPRDATSGHLNIELGDAVEWVPVKSIFALCSYPMRHNAIALSDMCQRPADTAVQWDQTGNYLYRCTHHCGEVKPGTIGVVFETVPRRLDALKQPVGVGVENPGADGLETGIVESVIAAHQMRVGWTGGIYCYCGDDRELGSAVAWRKHVAPLIIDALNHFK